MHSRAGRANAARMAFWHRTFTWWAGATWGTWLFTRLDGKQVGTDEQGNVYYERRKHGRSRRWVIYNGNNDGSRVPPGWQLWLRGTIDELPEEALPPKRAFEKRPEPNFTGTMQAYRPDGALGSNKVRPASTGDYQPWIPE